MNKKYVIELTTKEGKKGYFVKEDENGYMISEGGINPDVKQFDSPQHANKFLLFKRKKFKRNGIKVRIISLQELAQEGVAGLTSTSEMDLWYFENELGQKLFYNQEEEGYYFSSEETGYCVFDDKYKMQEMLDTMDFPCEAVIKKFEEPINEEE